MAARNRVIVDDRFRKLTGGVETNVRRALEHAAETTVIAARAGETRIRTGAMHEQITKTPVLRMRKGWMVYVYDPVFYARFQEFGTKGKRGAKTSARQKDIEGHRGVKPLRFLRNGVKVGRAVLLREMQNELL